MERFKLVRTLRAWPCALFVFLNINNCATLTTAPYATRISRLDFPVGALQKIAVEAMPLGLRTTSPNGRTFFSRYYVLDHKNYKPAGDSPERFSVTIFVLGDQRPYEMEVSVLREVRVQRRETYEYRDADHDRQQAKELAAKIQDRLTKRREDLNIIDDFRVF